MKASEMYKRGKYTTCSFQDFGNGIKEISLYNPKDSRPKKHFKFKVKDLNTPTEEIIEDEE